MTPDDTATAYANCRAFAEAFMAHCPGDLIRSIDPEPGDEAVWPVRLKLTELLAVLDERDVLAAERDESRAVVALFLARAGGAATFTESDMRRAAEWIAFSQHAAAQPSAANGES